jgi:hypothetical protein
LKELKKLFIEELKYIFVGQNPQQIGAANRGTKPVPGTNPEDLKTIEDLKKSEEL